MKLSDVSTAPIKQATGFTPSVNVKAQPERQTGKRPAKPRRFSPDALAESSGSAPRHASGSGLHLAQQKKDKQEQKINSAPHVSKKPHGELPCPSCSQTHNEDLGNKGTV